MIATTPVVTELRLIILLAGDIETAGLAVVEPPLLFEETFPSEIAESWNGVAGGDVSMEKKVTSPPD